jgi:hypothetical protein
MDVDDCVDDEEYDRDREDEWLEVDRGEAMGGGGVEGVVAFEDVFSLLAVGSDDGSCMAFAASRCCFRSRSGT